MSTIWKNKYFRKDSDPKNTPTSLSPEEDIYKDFNYKKIPPVSDDWIITSPPFVEPSKTQEPFDMLDTSVLDVDDRKDPINISQNEIIFGITEEPTPSNDEKNKPKEETPVDVNANVIPKLQATNYTQMYINDVKNILNEVPNKGKELSRKFTINRFYEIIGLSISVPTRIFYRTLTYLSQNIVYLLNKFSGEKEIDIISAEYKQLINVVNKMVDKYASIFVAFFIGINWWYIFAYYYNYIDISKLLDIEGLKIFTESHLAFVSNINYLLLGRKNDQDNIAMKVLNKLLWSYRHVVFGFFMFVFKYVVTNYKPAIENSFFRAISLQSSTIGSIALFYFFTTFIKMDILNPIRMYHRVSICGIIITIFIVLFKLLFLLAFIPFGTLFVYLYLFIFSFFGIFIAGGFNIFKSVSMLHEDIKMAVPKPDDRQESDFEKLKRLFFKNVSKMVIIILAIWTATENLLSVKQAKQNNPTYSSLYILALLILICSVGSLLYIIVFEIIGKVVDISYLSSLFNKTNKPNPSNNAASNNAASSIIPSYVNTRDGYPTYGIPPYGIPPYGIPTYGNSSEGYPTYGIPSNIKTNNGYGGE